MFTGIVESRGTVASVEDLDTTRRFTVRAELARELKPGDSVAVDGACLTAVSVDEDTFSVDVIGTTLEKTIAGSYRLGTDVNLERAVRVGDRLDGHIVQGHVDTVGHLKLSVKDGEYWIMDFEVPEGVLSRTILHGSIALNGVSLTVAELPEPGICRIGVIPYTHEHTNLGALGPGSPVNVEGDLIGKYVARLVAPGEPGSESKEAS